MVEVFGFVLGVLVVASLATIAVYLLVSVAAAATTLLGARRHRRLIEELDEVLVEILGPRTAGGGPEPGRSRSARRD